MSEQTPDAPTQQPPLCEYCRHRYDFHVPAVNTFLQCRVTGCRCGDYEYPSASPSLASQVQAVVEAVKVYHEAQRRTFGDVKIVHSGRCGAELQAVIDAADRLSTLAQEGT